MVNQPNLCRKSIRIMSTQKKNNLSRTSYKKDPFYLEFESHFSNSSKNISNKMYVGVKWFFFLIYLVPFVIHHFQIQKLAPKHGLKFVMRKNCDLPSIERIDK